MRTDGNFYDYEEFDEIVNSLSDNDVEQYEYMRDNYRNFVHIWIVVKNSDNFRELFSYLFTHDRRVQSDEIYPLCALVDEWSKNHREIPLHLYISLSQTDDMNKTQANVGE